MAHWGGAVFFLKNVIVLYKKGSGLKEAAPNNRTANIYIQDVLRNLFWQRQGPFRVHLHERLGHVYCLFLRVLY